MNKVYSIITDTIIKKLEEGTVPWHMPWSSDGPRNLISGKAYRGINVFLLGSLGYMSPYWLTFKQAQSLGGHVNKGEKSVPVVFWKTWSQMETDSDTGKHEKVSRFVLRYYRVFNLEQCTLPAEEIPQADPTLKSFDPIPLPSEPRTSVRADVLPWEALTCDGDPRELKLAARRCRKEELWRNHDRLHLALQPPHRLQTGATRRLAPHRCKPME